MRYVDMIEGVVFDEDLQEVISKSAERWDEQKRKKNCKVVNLFLTLSLV